MLGSRIRVSAFRWVPDFARGKVRDLRVRWALEEAGLPYETEAIDFVEKRSPNYLCRQPFGQVPLMEVDGEAMFESGAIVLKIAEQYEPLLSRASRQRDQTLSWLFASLSSVEPAIMTLAELDFFVEDETVKARHRSFVLGNVVRRLDDLERALGDRSYLVDEFSVADLMMTTVLRILDHTALLAERPTLASYVQRCTTRPAFKRALQAQLRVFDENAPVSE
ncbi:glutathione S-transferase family protein [Salinicola halimionae]|uniref:glutathione S-transferase family protein n=1 Tax=Salinicola halimionae TaxID=1949081 RepID=UPI000DA10DFB|nr:glutathione S-transferase family protein [Salinicola halimionae]